MFDAALQFLTLFEQNEPFRCEEINDGHDVELIVEDLLLVQNLVTRFLFLIFKFFHFLAVSFKGSLGFIECCNAKTNCCYVRILVFWIRTNFIEEVLGVDAQFF